MRVKLLSFPSETNQKVAGIKALRAAFGLGLKEAKDLIEDLQLKNEHELDCHDNDALVDFKRAGGNIAEVDQILLDQLTTVATSAIVNGSYDLAADVLEVLKKHNG